MNERFDYILVDEYQDTNRLQSSILHRMRSLNRNLTVVGDDAQRIYSFRAAEVRNILDFPAEFPEATVVTLETNYRFTQPILDVTNRIIGLSPKRHAKELRSVKGNGPSRLSSPVSGKRIRPTSWWRRFLSRMRTATGQLYLKMIRPIRGAHEDRLAPEKNTRLLT